MSGEKEQDLDLLTEDEAAALKEVPPLTDLADDEPEPEATPDKVEAEPSEVKEEVEEPPAKEPEPEPTEPAPEKKEEPKTIDGILAKDGKNVIPFSVLESERAEKKAAVEERQRLEAEIAELRKRPIEAPRREPEPLPKKEERPAFDVKAIAKDFATKTYESVDDAAVAAENLINSIKDQVSAELKGEVTREAKAVSAQVEFEREVGRIKTANPWIAPGENGKPSPTEQFLVTRAFSLMEDRKIAMDDVRGMVKAAEDAVIEGRKLFKIDQPVITEADVQKKVDAAVAAAVKKNTEEVLAKFNIKPETDVRTLANAKNLNPDTFSKFDEIEKLNGVDFEEAFAQLTPEEKERFLVRSTA